jgi:hypothetical protein
MIATLMNPMSCTKYYNNQFAFFTVFCY